MYVLRIFVVLCIRITVCSVHMPEHGNFTDTFNIASPHAEILTIYYGDEESISSVLLYTGSSLQNFSISIESSKTDVAQFSEEVIINPCQEKTNPNHTAEAFHYSSAENQYIALHEATTCYNLSFYSMAVYIGYSNARFYANINNDSQNIYIAEILFRSIRKPKLIDKVYSVSVMVLVTVVMLAAGNNLDFDTIKEHLKRPKAPAVATLSQFTVMPLIAYGIIWLMGYTGGKALGFFTLGCSPGGGTSNVYTKLSNGDLSLSVTLTTLSTIVSLGTLPMWLYTLGSTIPADEGVDKIKIPFLNILQSLAFIVIPLAIGALMKYKLPRVALIIKKWLNALFIFALITFVTLAIYVKFYIFFGWDFELVVSACCLPYGGYIIGAFLAWVFRFDWTLIKTISIETGMQSAAVCILVVMSVSGQPDNDLALILPIASTLVAGWPFFLILPIYILRQKIFAKRKARREKQKHSNNTPFEEINLEESKLPLDPENHKTESSSASSGSEPWVELKLLTV
ncbi:hepatic sodium/bile acid cotransporter-like [Watersipora subatra]|uniref:hepatic sodium/bile acid cotransporter-like n=1 Tax=Watersipora subatra TaxID=2589382 RepID=UPI00355AE8FF